MPNDLRAYDIASIYRLINPKIGRWMGSLINEQIGHKIGVEFHLKLMIGVVT